MGAEELGDLGEEQPDAARGRVDEHPVALLDRVGIRRQVVRGHPLEQDRGGDLGRNAFGNRHQPAGVGGHALGVAVGNVHPGDAIALAVDPTRALDPDDRRRRRAVPSAFAFVHVAEVHAHRLDVDHDPAIRGLRLGCFLEFEDLGSAVALENHCVHLLLT